MIRLTTGDKIPIYVAPFWSVVRVRQFADRDITERTLQHWPTGEVKVEYRDGLNKLKER